MCNKSNKQTKIDLSRDNEFLSSSLLTLVHSVQRALSGPPGNAHRATTSAGTPFLARFAPCLRLVFSPLLAPGRFVGSRSLGRMCRGRGVHRSVCAVPSEARSAPTAHAVGSGCHRLDPLPTAPGASRRYGCLSSEPRVKVSLLCSAKAIESRGCAAPSSRGGSTSGRRQLPHQGRGDPACVREPPRRGRSAVALTAGQAEL